MNWSAAEVSELPDGLLTVTSTTPAAWAGVLTMMVLSERMEK